MSLILFDSFELYATSFQVGEKWAISGNPLAAIGRNGGKGLNITNTSSGSATASFTPTPTIIFGAATLVAGSSNTQNCIAFSTATNLIQIRYQSDGSIAIIRDTTVIAVSEAGVVNNAYRYVEIKLSPSASIAANSCIIRVDGIEVMNLPAGTDLGSSTLISSLRLGTTGATVVSTTYFDDIYICNALGTRNNDFLGDVEIKVIKPNAPGVYQEFTPSTGVDHVALVDETSIDTADFLTGTVSGQKETFQMGAFSTTGEVLAIQTKVAVRKATQGAGFIKPIIKSGAVEVVGAARGYNTTTEVKSTLYELDPDGSVPWTVAKVDAIEVGIQTVIAA